MTENTNIDRSEGDSEPQSLDLLQKIKSGQMEAKLDDPEKRRLLVALLMKEGHSTPEIAHLLKVSDRTIERDRQALRESNAITKDPKLVEQMAGKLLAEAELCIQRIRKFARDKEALPSVKIDAEDRCFHIAARLTECLQSLGYLPIAARKLTAELTCQTQVTFDLDQLGAEVERLQQIEGEFTEKDSNTAEIVTKFEDENSSSKGEPNENNK
jgi:transposase